jgi:hypothetical protein
LTRTVHGNGWENAVSSSRKSERSHDPEVIKVDGLASFAIHPHGDDVEIGLMASDDRRVILKLHPDTLATVFALIPKMLELALERLTGDAGARQVFGLESWRVVAVNDGAARIITLCAANDFKVSFLAAADVAVQLAQALHRDSSDALPHVVWSTKH